MEIEKNKFKKIIMKIKTHRFHGNKIRCIMKQMNVNQIKYSTIEVPPGAKKSFSRPLTLETKKKTKKFLHIITDTTNKEIS